MFHANAQFLAVFQDVTAVKSDGGFQTALIIFIDPSFNAPSFDFSASLILPSWQFLVFHVCMGLCLFVYSSLVLEESLCRASLGPF